jgi:hypothetical protein
MYIEEHFGGNLKMIKRSLSGLQSFTVQYLPGSSLVIAREKRLLHEPGQTGFNSSDLTSGLIKPLARITLACGLISRIRLKNLVAVRRGKPISDNTRASFPFPYERVNTVQPSWAISIS